MYSKVKATYKYVYYGPDRLTGPCECLEEKKQILLCVQSTSDFQHSRSVIIAIQSVVNGSSTVRQDDEGRSSGDVPG